MMQCQQINLLYNVLSGSKNNVNVFVGAQYSAFGEGGRTDEHEDPASDSYQRSLWGGQIGFQAAQVFFDKFTVYEQAQYGWPYWQAGAGVSYSINRALDINLSADYVSGSPGSFVNGWYSWVKDGSCLYSIPVTLGLTLKI